MSVNNDRTRLDSGLPPDVPPEGVGADAMRASIASDLFGDVAVPLQIGRYEVQGAVGEGGMGVVYSGWDASLGRKVALKLLSRAYSGNERRRGRMVREAQALAKLSHPNVVQVYEVGEHDEDVYVAMELVDGLSLRDWCHKAKRSPAEIEDVFTQAGRGLSAAHRADIVHRDFKPTNVIVGTDGRVRVLDFGLAHGPGISTDNSGPIASPGSERLTKTGAVMGTPAYMAPELLRGDAADSRADQFSFCVALFEALTGSRPYRFITLRDEPEQAEIIGWSSVPRMWRGAIRRGLSVDPKDRWPSMDDLLEGLRRGRVWFRRAPWLAAGGLGLALWVPSMAEAKDPCATLPESPRGWSKARAAGLRQTFAATGAPFADDVWRTAKSSIDTFADTWTETRSLVCTAGARPEALACLQRSNTVLEVVLSEYERVDATNVGSVHPLATLLESPAICTETASASGQVELDDEVLADLARAEAQVAAVRPDVALAGLETLADHPRLRGTEALSEVYRLRARTLAQLGRDDEALDAVARSRNEADGASARVESLVTWIRLLLSQERFQSARDGLRLLRQLVSSDSPARLRAELVEADASLLLATEQVEASIASFERALELRETTEDPEQISRARMLLAGALAESRSNASLERAESLYRAEVAALSDRLGTQHPLYAAALFNLATFLADIRLDWTRALDLLERCEAIEARSLEEDSPYRARTRLKIGEALLNLERPDEAEEFLNSAWSRLEALPPTHTDHIAGRTLLAGFTMDQGQHALSLTHHRELAKVQPDNLLVQQNIAFLSSELGDADTARAAIRRARELLTSSGLDAATVKLLQLYFKSIDAKLAILEQRPDDAMRIIESIESGMDDYVVPEKRPDLQGQLDALRPGIDALREEHAAK